MSEESAPDEFIVFLTTLRTDIDTINSKLTDIEERIRKLEMSVLSFIGVCSNRS